MCSVQNCVMCVQSWFVRCQGYMYPAKNGRYDFTLTKHVPVSVSRQQHLRRSTKNPQRAAIVLLR
jgi:hypothetical protein